MRNMKKIAKYIMLLMTAIVITTAAVSCSKDSENEPDPTPTPVPDDPSNPGNTDSDSKSILGYWQEREFSSDERSVGVTNFRENGSILSYWWWRDNGSGETETGADTGKYYYDGDKGYIVLYYLNDSNDGKEEWLLWKIIALDTDVLSMVIIAEDGEDYDVSGSLNANKCQQIINHYYELDLPYDNDAIDVYTRISEKEFSSWWNSLSD